MKLTGNMKSKIYKTMDEAVADIPDGATVAFGGFARTGFPRNLTAALLRQGAANLTGLSNGVGGGQGPDVMDVVKLVEAGRMKKMVCAFTASPHPSRKNALERMEEAGEIEAAAVMVNDHTAFRVDWMPFAGRRQSGYGIGGIGYTMHDMTQDKMAVVKL